MRHLLLIIAAGLLCCLAGCSDDLLTDVASQPMFALNDSDGYNMGILLRGHTTATQRLMLYNHNSGEIALQSVRLRGGDSSIFRINVDGMAGTDFTNPDFLHIAQGDSLCILLEAAYSGAQQEREVIREDYIDIQCNGRLSSIRLKVTTRDIEELRNDTIRRDTLWAMGGLDKLVYGPLVVDSGATLTIGPGVTLYLHDHAGIQVYGTLKMLGDLEHPVTLIGDRTDKIFDNLYYRDMAAQWGGIDFYPSSRDNLMQYAVVRGMTTGIRLQQDSTDTHFLAEAPSGEFVTSDPKRYAYGPDFLSDERQQLIIRNSLIMNSSLSLISAVRSNMIVENSCLMNSAAALLELSGGAYDITHCTLANYNYWALFSLQDVSLANHAAQIIPVADRTTPADSVLMVPSPLYRCNFTNSIVYGKSGFDPNILTSFIRYVDDQGAPLDSIFNYRFDHCLLHSTSGFDDEDCISILWSEDPLYQLVDMPNYTVDPHLQPESPCIGYGEPRTTERLPLDRDGKTRSAQPTIGCYEP